jgi:phosphate-selective porin OprO/OprP
MTFLVLVLALSFSLAASALAADDLETRVEQLERELAALKAGRVMAAEEVEGVPLMPYWDNGLFFQSPDGVFVLNIGGRVYIDYAHLDADDEFCDIGYYCGDFYGRDCFREWKADQAEIRSARFHMAGQIYRNTGYKLEVEFNHSGDGRREDVDITDAYLTVDELLPAGVIKIGHQKEPFSLEMVTSSRFITFMERALPVAYLAPGRNLGLSVSDTAMDERMTWAAGVFVDGRRGSTEEGVALTGRATWLPYYEEDGRKLVHLGAAYTHRDPDEYTGSLVLAETHLFDPICVGAWEIDPVDDASRLGLEAAAVCGPLSVQGEYFTGDVNGDDRQSDIDHDGYYVYASYFLTGENRVYNRRTGGFDRVRPNQNFDGQGGWGAWEVALRYSEFSSEKNSSMKEEITLNGLTFGLNWYLNPNMRFMLNYVTQALDKKIDFGESCFKIDGDADAVMGRFQVDF